jgi:hypothetical protein
LNDSSNHDKRVKAYQIIHDKFLEPISDDVVGRYDFSRVSPKAIAMADAIRPAFIDVLNKYRNQYHYNDEEFNRAFIPISKSISDLAQGKFLGKRFDPEAFGIKPIDVTVSMVLKQAREVYGFYLPNLEADKYENEVFEAIMSPALSKLLGMMKYLVALPGMPTLFDGDDVGATGYDTETKNMYLQGRQRVHDEWLIPDSGKYKDFIAKHKGYFDEVMGVRRNPKCNALNNGAIFTFTFSTAFCTPRPEYRPSPSRSSTASYRPVDAPEGTLALAVYFPANTTSASTVGLPLESRISLANISVIGKYSYNIKKNLLILCN